MQYSKQPKTGAGEDLTRLTVVELMEYILVSTSFLNIAVYGMAISVFVLTGHIPPTTHLSPLPVLVMCTNFPTTMLVFTVMQ